MKNVILLQNSQAFTVDISQISNPHNYKLFLIINPESLAKLYERQQEHFFEKIIVTQDFSFMCLVDYINTIITSYSNIPIDIVTNSEWCVNVCGQLRTHYGLNGLDATIANRFTNKLTMKRTLEEHHIRIPRYMSLDLAKYYTDKTHYIKHIIKELGFPVFAKPIDDANSNGTAKLDNLFMLENWLNTKNGNQSFELDEYIQGRLFHCDTFIKDNKILYTQVSEYAHPVFSYLQGKSIGSITLPESTSESIRLREFNQKILEVLEYRGSGITHLEAFITNKNEIIFLEIAARAGGAWLPRIYHQHLNINLFETHFLLQINDKYAPSFDKKGPYCACLWFPAANGTVLSLYKPNLNSSYEIKFFVKEGQTMKQTDSLRNKVAQIILWNDSFEMLYADFNLSKKLDVISYY